MKRINYKRTLLPVMLTAMLLTSCSQNLIEENIPDTSGNSGDICFNISFAPRTRLTTDGEFKSAWQDYDAIGIFAVRHVEGEELSLSPSDNYIQNVSMGYRTSNGGGWTPAQQLWWPSGGDKLDFYAYYPYDRTITDPTQIIYNLDADQHKWNNGRPYINRQDLMTAKADNNGKGYGRGETVSLNFSHALVMVQLSIPTSGKGAGPDENTSVTLKGVKLKSVLDLGGKDGPEAELAMEDNPAVDVKMHRVEIIGDEESYKKYTYRALIPVQTLQEKDDFFMIASGGDLYQGKGVPDEMSVNAGTAVSFTRTIPNKLHTVNIKAGEFMMGSPVDDPWRDEFNETQHRVTLTKDFRITRYNITNTQFAEFLNAENIQGVQSENWLSEGGYDLIFVNNVWNVQWNGNEWEPAKGKEDYPAVCVTWHGADKYARWAGGTLPTEAQWEYACRAGTDTPFSFGDYDADGEVDLDVLLMHAWCGPNSGGRPKEIGRLDPNPWGLYDIHGNVSDWCSDWYDDNYGLTQEQMTNGVIDPTGAMSGNKRTLRSGNYNSMPESCRSAYRTSDSPGRGSYYYSFRVVFNQ